MEFYHYEMHNASWNRKSKNKIQNDKTIDHEDYTKKFNASKEENDIFPAKRWN